MKSKTASKLLALPAIFGAAIATASAGEGVPVTESGKSPVMDSGKSPVTDSGKSTVTDSGKAPVGGNAELSGVIYYDLNEDGQRDPVDPGRAGVEVSLFDVNGKLVAKTLTDEFGFYRFDVPPGDYLVAHSGVRTPIGLSGTVTNFNGPIFIDRTHPQIRGLNVLDPRLLTAQNLVREPDDGRRRPADAAASRQDRQPTSPFRR